MLSLNPVWVSAWSCICPPEHRVHRGRPEPPRGDWRHWWWFSGGARGVTSSALTWPSAHHPNIPCHCCIQPLWGQTTLTIPVWLCVGSFLYWESGNKDVLEVQLWCFPSPFHVPLYGLTWMCSNIFKLAEETFLHICTQEVSMSEVVVQTFFTGV